MLRGLNGGDDVGAGVGCDVENGIDHEGEQGKGDLAGEEPDECHCCSKQTISLILWVVKLRSRRYAPRY